MLVATGVGLGWHAVLTFAPLLPTAIHNLALADLLQSGAPAPVMTGTLAWAAVATAVASVAAKEVLYRATIRVGRRIGSNVRGAVALAAVPQMRSLTATCRPWLPTRGTTAQMHCLPSLRWVRCASCDECVVP